jgi:NAD(P)-dependent dehydrogenase (short-subunit alcohol dehydrogenase family)
MIGNVGRKWKGSGMSRTGNDFAGRVVVVTGGTRGIGWQCAQAFAARGARVLACGFDAAELEAVRRAGVANVEAHHVDVRSEAGVRRFFDSHGVAAGVDVLVNCAGIQRFGNAVETTLDDWNEVMQVNVTGAFLASRHAIPLMRKRGGGAVVNVASIHARVTAGGRVAYVTSKTALMGLTRALSLDHAADRIRVNVVLPGTVETPMLLEGWARLRPDRTIDQMRRDVGAANPLGRIGMPDDVAAAIVFLASDEAAFITGAELVVDGGVSNKLALPVVGIND